jgi:ankyrin repeat protein
MYFKDSFYKHYSLFLRISLTIILIIGLLQCECSNENQTLPDQQNQNKHQSSGARSKKNGQGSTQNPSNPSESDKNQEEQKDNSSPQPEDDKTQQDHKKDDSNAPASDTNQEDQSKKPSTNSEPDKNQDNQKKDTPTSGNDELADKIIEDVTDPFLKDTLKSLKAGNKESLQKDNNTTFSLLESAVKEPQNNVPILAYLVGRGNVNVDTPIEYGATVLTSAVQASIYKPEVVKFLLAHHANPNVADQYGRTPLDTAIYTKNLGATKLLIEAGVDCNAVCGEDGYRPLHQAGAKQDIEIVKYLLSKGANKNLLNYKGKRPYDCAYGANVKELLK